MPIMFSGGNQLRLTSTFGGTPFLANWFYNATNDEAHFLVAGTSAGAMAMSNTMIYEGNAGTAHLKGEVKITTGLGLMHERDLSIPISISVAASAGWHRQFQVQPHPALASAWEKIPAC
jgi:hypothetical protein